LYVYRDETPNSEKDLSYYSSLGDLKKVEEMLLTDSSIVNEKDSEGLCALHYAADRGNKDLLLLLLKHGADLNIQVLHLLKALHSLSNSFID
jgi:ankyrin repeat protein